MLSLPYFYLCALLLLPLLESTPTGGDRAKNIQASTRPADGLSLFYLSIESQTHYYYLNFGMFLSVSFFASLISFVAHGAVFDEVTTVFFLHITSSPLVCWFMHWMCFLCSSCILLFLSGAHISSSISMVAHFVKR